jgi:LacI family transcriptional regulator
MTTIKDIARESGYSISTVSRVLNHKGDVSEKTRLEIEEVVDRFHFVPNNNAKHLKQSNSRYIGVLVKGTSNMLFANILEEIQTRIEKTDYTLIVSYIDEDSDEVEQAILLCRERRPVGVIFLGGNPEHFDDSFREVDVPCVLVTNTAKQLDFPNLSSVATDNVIAAKAAVDSLFEAGHTKIAILGGNIDKSYTSLQRYKGCKESFAEHGVSFDQDKCFESARYSFESAARGMKRLIGRYPDLTAIFAMSDVMAIGAIRALRDMGYSVPDDVSVVGFDGTELAEYYNPRLTTVRQHYQRLAVRSIELLVAQIDLKYEPVHELVSFELVDGESVKKSQKG